jgi:hypothetical protein
MLKKHHTQQITQREYITATMVIRPTRGNTLNNLCHPLFPSQFLGNLEVGDHCPVSS